MEGLKRVWKKVHGCCNYPYWARLRPWDAAWGNEPEVGSAGAGKRSESFAFTAHGWARAPVAFLISAFFNPYLSTLAQFVAVKSASSTVSWLGVSLSPTSYPSAYTTVYSILAAIIAPFLGALGDTSPNRRKLLIWFSNGTAVFAILMIAVVADTWWLGGLLAIVCLTCYESSLVFVYAYLPEISTTQSMRSKVSAQALVASNLSQVLTALLIVGVSGILEPPGVDLVQGSFESLSSNPADWSLLQGSSSLFPNVSSGIACSAGSDIPELSSYCEAVRYSDAYAGRNALAVSLANASQYSVAQVSTQDQKDYQGSEIIFKAYGRLQAPEIGSTIVARVWQGNSVTASTPATLDANGFVQVQVLSAVSKTTSSLAFDVIVTPSSSSSSNGVYLDSLDVITKPSLFPVLYMAFGGIWFYFFGTMSYAHFKQRLPSTYSLAAEASRKEGKSEDTKQANRRTFCCCSRETQQRLFVLPVSRVLNTMKDAWKKPFLLFWLLGYAFYAAGATGVVSVAAVFFVEELYLPVFLSAIILLFSQIVGIFGAILFHFIGRKIGSQTSLLLTYVLFTIALVYGFLFVKATESGAPSGHVWVLASMIGGALGGCIAEGRSAFSELIPTGQEAEYYGFYNFDNKVISWLGPLLFTVANEAAGSVRLAFLSLAILFLLSALFQLLSIIASRGIPEKGRSGLGNLEQKLELEMTEDLDKPI